MTLQSSFEFFAKMMRGSCVFCCSSCISFNPTSHLKRNITSKRQGGFYCLNCLHSFPTTKKLSSHEKLWKNKDFCGNITSSKKNNILQFKQYIKSNKMTYIVYDDIESLIRK